MTGVLKSSCAIFDRYGTPGGVDWLQLGQDVEASAINRQVPAVTFMLGKFEPPAKKAPKERRRRQEAPTEPQEKVNEVHVEDLMQHEANKAQTARMKVLVNTLMDAVSAAEASGAPRRVNLFHLLLNPESFSQTVENFFDLAFLIKTGHAQLIAEGTVQPRKDRLRLMTIPDLLSANKHHASPDNLLAIPPHVLS